MSYYTKITIEEMLLAKTDEDTLLAILKRIDKYLLYVVEKMYHVYGARHDPALTREDLYEFCKINIIRGIKHYYHPERYMKGKDASGNYLDGFTFIVNITNRFVKYYWKYHHRKKRIPPELITSLNVPVVQGEHIVMLDVLGESDDTDTEFRDYLIQAFAENDRKIRSFTLKELIGDIVERNLNYKQIAKKYRIKPSVMRQIIRENIVDPHQRTVL